MFRGSAGEVVRVVFSLFGGDYVMPVLDLKKALGCKQLLIIVERSPFVNYSSLAVYRREVAMGSSCEPILAVSTCLRVIQYNVRYRVFLR